MSRIEKIDCLKGIAVILMIIFHFFSLIDAKNNTSYTSHPYLFITGHISRIIFIFLLGFNFKLNKNNKKFHYKFFSKILLLIFMSLIVNLTTLIFYPNNYVRFGILHFLTCSLLLLFCLSKITNILPLISSIIMFIVYIFVLNKKSSKNLLLTSIGYKPSFSTMDYFPIFKWFWLVCLGYLVSNNIKINTNPIKNKILKGISYLGKKSLLIYVCHFPIIYGIHKIFKYY